MSKLGFRINSSETPRDQALVSSLKEFPTCNLADVMGRFHVMDPGIQPVDRQMKLAGHAVTVQCRPGDNLMLHKALEVAKPGDILVVNTNGNTTSAVFGELMCRTAMGAKLGGIVVDGAVRDVLALSEQGFPTFSRSVCASGCDKDGPGEINYSIASGGVSVQPGDIIVGDADGVVVIPLAEAKTVLEKVRVHMANEHKRIEEINSGVLFKPEINEILAAKGVK
ncbi:RraA family protein [Ammoniphilus sp. CFH 90114]|uniref:RraA family protein n=1 Tax=Ammoniphilus sp. CFH 90114 TaxID=2493665 RepID=UPI00100F733B|nr:RraA family protein [Ammoniphilus sp. CFH 90114]RXT00617.1 RraA family protein [Ammoniphilus sp. CFH 90114]